MSCPLNPTDTNTLSIATPVQESPLTGILNGRQVINTKEKIHEIKKQCDNSTKALILNGLVFTGGAMIVASATVAKLNNCVKVTPVSMFQPLLGAESVIMCDRPVEKLMHFLGAGGAFLLFSAGFFLSRNASNLAENKKFVSWAEENKKELTYSNIRENYENFLIEVNAN